MCIFLSLIYSDRIGTCNWRNYRPFVNYWPNISHKQTVGIVCQCTLCPLWQIYSEYILKIDKQSLSPCYVQQILDITLWYHASYLDLTHWQALRWSTWITIRESKYLSPLQDKIFYQKPLFLLQGKNHGCKMKVKTYF